jgi:hypothetical protein
VTVTVYEPAVPEHDNDDVELELVVVRERLVGLRRQVRPVNGETVCDSATVPANPSNPVATTVDGPVDPARTVNVVGLVVSAKSWIV